MKSDYNGDGEVTIADAVLLARFVGEDTTFTNEGIDKILSAVPDLDDDGFVTIMDASYDKIQRMEKWGCSLLFHSSRDSYRINSKRRPGHENKE